MRRTTTTIAGLLGAAAATLLLATGCANPQAASDFEIDASEYETVFDATIAALRREQFRLDRVDRRLGVITTQPRTSGSIAEPWRRDNSTPAQAWESTLHHQRRTIRVEFLPAAPIKTSDATAADAAVTASPPPFEPLRADGPLLVDVRVTIERAHRPGRQIETVSLRDSSYGADPQLVERGVPRTFWEPIARDPYLEKRVAHRIRSMAGEALESSEDDAAEG